MSICKYLHKDLQYEESKKGIVDDEVEVSKNGRACYLCSKGQFREDDDAKQNNSAKNEPRYNFILYKVNCIASQIEQ